jgi:hypothetical protein
VNWVVFRTPIEASPEQIERYGAVFPMDARPTQPLDRRLSLRVAAKPPLDDCLDTLAPNDIEQRARSR